MPIVLVTNLAAEPEARWHAALADALPEEHIVRSAGADAEPGAALTVEPGAIDVAIVANPEPDALAPYTGLAFVQSLWAGVEKLIHHPGLPPSARLARLVDPNMAQYMAEAVLAHVMALHRDHDHYGRAQRAKRWAPVPVAYATDRAVGFLGTGALAQACMAKLAPVGFRLLGWSRGRRVIAGVMTYSGNDGLQRMLGEVDILVNLLPLTAATRNLIDARLLARLRPGAALVNVARGGHVVDADLVAALDAGQIRAAALDVFHDEPLAQNHPFWRHERIQVFPHVAAPTDLASASRLAAANVRAFRAGHPISGLVDRTRGY